MKWLETWNSSKHKKWTRLWIAIVILIMIVYTVCCFFIIDKYADTEEPLNTNIVPDAPNLSSDTVITDVSDQIFTNTVIPNHEVTQMVSTVPVWPSPIPTGHTGKRSREIDFS